MAGYGIQPAGTSPAGLGTPALAAPNAGAALTDPNTGAQTGGRLIDTRTRDYVADANGRLAGMSNVPQLVYLAIATVKSSSAVRDLGMQPQGSVVTSNIQAVVLNMLRDAVNDLVSAGLVQVLGLEQFRVGPDGVLLAGATYGHFRYRDLTTGLEATLPV
jgi:hypothetical protein